MLIEEQISIVPEQAAVRLQLAKILQSSQFSRSNRISDFLSFVVINGLDGHDEVLKESCIGSMVFGRESAYDPKIDPIVRVEARRLRGKLQEYYETDGIADTILITIPKGGYRAVIESREIAAPVAPPAPASIPALDLSLETAVQAEPQLQKKLSYTKMSYLAVATATGIAIFLWFLLHHPADARSARLAPLTSYIGQEFEPAISPDGRHLAFVWNGDGSNYDIYVKSLPNGDPVRLTVNPAHDLFPAWSLDGRDIAFLRMTPTASQIISIPVTGGPEQVLGEVHSAVSVWRADASQITASLGPSWSPDGHTIAVSDGGSIYLWPLALGERRRLTFPSAGSDDFFPSISPDGESLALVRQTSNSTADVYTLSLSDPGAAPRRITHDNTGIRGIAWTADGRSLILSSNRYGYYSLWRVSLASGNMDPLTTSSAQAMDPSISRSSGSLAYTETMENTNIWRLPITKSAIDKTTPPVRLISSSRRNNSPQYSPDGQQIAFISDRSGNWELWTAHADGTGGKQLTFLRGHMLGTPHWSPDGKWIAFDARPGDHSLIFLIPSTGGEPKRIGQENFEERMPTWSNDGQHLFFNSNRSGSVRLWKMTPEGKELTVITDRTAYDSFASSDGVTIYFLSDGPGIWEVPATGGIAKLIPELANVDHSRYVTLVGHTLYYVERENAPRQIKAYDFNTRKVRNIGQIERNLVSGTPSFSVSPDEHFLLFAQQDESSSDILSAPIEP